MSESLTEWIEQLEKPTDGTGLDWLDAAIEMIKSMDHAASITEALTIVRQFTVQYPERHVSFVCSDFIDFLDTYR